MVSAPWPLRSLITVGAHCLEKAPGSKILFVDSPVAPLCNSPRGLNHVRLPHQKSHRRPAGTLARIPAHHGVTLAHRSYRRGAERGHRWILCRGYAQRAHRRRRNKGCSPPKIHEQKGGRWGTVRQGHCNLEEKKSNELRRRVAFR